MVKLLVAYGADAGARNVYGETPIHYAARRGELESVNALLASQSVVNGLAGMGTYRMRKNPLHMAAGGGHVEVIKRLIECKADPGTRDTYGLSPVLYASPKFPQAAKPIALVDPVMIALMNEKKRKGKKGAAAGKKKR